MRGVDDSSTTDGSDGRHRLLAAGHVDEPVFTGSCTRPPRMVCSEHPSIADLSLIFVGEHISASFKTPVRFSPHPMILE